METFEFYLEEFKNNAISVSYCKSASFTDLLIASDACLKEENLARILYENFPNRICEIAELLDDDTPTVRRSAAYLLLGKFEPDETVTQKAVNVLREYALASKGDETLTARGFLIAWGNKHGVDTAVNDDISLHNSLKNKYCNE